MKITPQDALEFYANPVNWQQVELVEGTGISTSPVEFDGGQMAACALAWERERLKGLAAIIGQWPGDETDEEVETQLREMS